ncbi:unnamed protein product [Boreogadus saida]
MICSMGISSDISLVDSALGKVQVGSPLSYQQPATATNDLSFHVAPPRPSLPLFGTSTSGIWVLLERKAGRWTVPGTRLSTKNPLSTMMADRSGVRRDVMPDCRNTSLSLMDPSNKADTNVRAPCGDIPTMALKVQGHASLEEQG